MQFLYFSNVSQYNIFRLEPEISSKCVMLWVNWFNHVQEDRDCAGGLRLLNEKWLAVPPKIQTFSSDTYIVGTIWCWIWFWRCRWRWNCLSFQLFLLGLLSSTNIFDKNINKKVMKNKACNKFVHFWYDL